MGEPLSERAQAVGAPGLAHDIQALEQTLAQREGEVERLRERVEDLTRPTPTPQGNVYSWQQTVDILKGDLERFRQGLLYAERNLGRVQAIDPTTGEECWRVVNRALRDIPEEEEEGK